MKNSNLFLLASLLFAMVSCGTLAQQGMYGTTQFRNSIYYSPLQQSVVYAQQPVQQPEQEQVPQQNFVSDNVYAGNNVQTVHVGDENQVDIQYTPGVTYVIADDTESYAARLRKFDSPVYNINIVFDDPYPWWSVDYAWGRWGWSSWRWGVSSWDRWYWYNTWNSPWYTPWYGHWHNHWYAGSYWDWYWGDPWWRHHHHRPVYHPVPGKGPGHARPGQKVYYGKRDASPSYRNPGKANITSSGASPMGKPSQGSVTRRPSDTRYNQGNQPQGGSKSQVQQQGGQKSQNNQYRRTEGNKENVKSTGNQSNRNTSGSQYNRSSSSSSSNRNNSSYSSGRSSYSSGGSSSRSGGSSSSYRRR